MFTVVLQYLVGEHYQTYGSFSNKTKFNFWSLTLLTLFLIIQPKTILCMCTNVFAVHSEVLLKYEVKIYKLPFTKTFSIIIICFNLGRMGIRNWKRLAGRSELRWIGKEDSAPGCSTLEEEKEEVLTRTAIYALC